MQQEESEIGYLEQFKGVADSKGFKVIDFIIPSRFKVVEVEFLD